MTGTYSAENLPPVGTEMRDRKAIEHAIVIGHGYVDFGTFEPIVILRHLHGHGSLTHPDPTFRWHPEWWQYPEHLENSAVRK